jgi:hypothetical protein
LFINRSVAEDRSKNEMPDEEKIIGILKDNIDNPEKSEAGMIKKNVWFYRNKPDKFIYFCQNKLG